MSFLRLNLKNTLAIKLLLVSLIIANVTACGDTKYKSGAGNGNNNLDDDQGQLPDALLEVLNLTGNEQLFSFKQSKSGSNSSLTAGAATSLTNSIDSTNNQSISALKILDENGKAKSYLKDARFDRFHVVRNGKDLAYIARIQEEDFENLKIAGGGWIILKNGEKPIPLKRPPMFKYIRDPSEFVGQTDLHDGLVFSYGTYVDLNGKNLSYGKNIDEVTAAQFVSGNFVALKRKINGKEVTTLANVKTDFRRAYDSYFTPDFVQITDDGKGLMSDIQASHNWFSKDTFVSRLEEEMSDKYINKSKRAPLFKDTDLKGCLWFNASVRVPKQDEALATCYVSGANKYKLVRISPSAKRTVALGAAGWKVKELANMKSESALDGVKVSRPFTQGNDFTLVRNGQKLLYVNHGNKGLVKKIATNMGTVFEIRTSNDLTQFFVIGEKANGDRVMAIYNGSNGDLVENKDIDEN